MKNTPGVWGQSPHEKMPILVTNIHGRDFSRPRPVRAEGAVFGGGGGCGRLRTQAALCCVWVAATTPRHNTKTQGAVYPRPNHHHHRTRLRAMDVRWRFFAERTPAAFGGGRWWMHSPSDAAEDTTQKMPIMITYHVFIIMSHFLRSVPCP